VRKLAPCTQCKKRKEGCDLGEMGFPCTRCREKNCKCEGSDSSRALQTQPEKKARTATELRERRPAEQSGQGASIPVRPPSPAWLFDHGYISGPAPEFQGVASRLSRREEGPPRPRSASPHPAALVSDKCDNCHRYGRFCEDIRPCYDCMDRNLVCNGSYMDNPYRSPRPDEGSDGSGNCWGTFGQGFGGYGNGNHSGGDMNDYTDPSLPEPWDWPGSSHQQYQDEPQSSLDFATHQAQPVEQNRGNSHSTVTKRHCGCSPEKSLTPLTEHRKLVNHHTDFDSRPMFAFRTIRVLQNAARASTVYDELAGNSMTLSLRPRALKFHKTQ
jgi:hypothetical protein